MLLDHNGCYTPFQARIPDLHITDINLTKPERLQNKIVFSGYIVLRGYREDKKRFFRQCKAHRTDAIKVNNLNKLTGFKLDPTILEYTMSSPKCYTSAIYNSGVDYVWPLPLQVIGGLEESLVVGTKERLSVFRDECEKIGTPTLTYIKEEDFHARISELVSSASTDLVIVAGLETYERYKRFVFQILKDEKKMNFISSATKLGILSLKKIDRDVKIRELAERYGITYRLARHLIGEMRKVSSNAGQDLLKQIVRKSRNMLRNFDSKSEKL
jgi:hypothetical protein